MFSSNNIENNFFLKLGYSFDPKDLKRGLVLISEPFLADPNFSRSVVLITEYNASEGAFGFIINKPTSLLMSDVIDSFNADQFYFNVGGPVNADTVFFLHDAAVRIPESKKIMEGLNWSGNYEAILSLANTGQVGPNQVKFYGGYSGWSAGQLEAEIKEHSWIIGNLSAEQVMFSPPQEMWRQALKKLGPKFSVMSNFPENPELN